MRIVAALSGGAIAVTLVLLGSNYPTNAPLWAHVLNGALSAIIGFTFARAYGPRRP